MVNIFYVKKRGSFKPISVIHSWMMYYITCIAYWLFKGYNVGHEITLNITFQSWINYPYLDGSEAGELTKAEFHVKQRNSHNRQGDEVRNNKCACEQ